MDVLVNVDVDDLEKAVTFYTSAFGLTVGRRLGCAAVELLGASSSPPTPTPPASIAAWGAGRPAASPPRPPAGSLPRLVYRLA